MKRRDVVIGIIGGIAIVACLLVMQFVLNQTLAGIL